MPGPATSLRAFVQDLESLGRLRAVTARVDPAWELACIARWVAATTGEDDACALRFDDAGGSPMSVVLGLFASHGLVARSLGAERDGVWPLLARALDAPLEPERVASGSVKQSVERGDAVDLTAWPIPIWTPGRDRAPYLTTACVVTVDRETGVPNAGTYRVEVQGPRRLGLAFGSEQQHGAAHRRTWEEAGEPMPVALVLGAAPAVSYAAAAKARYGVDELAVAGGLLGRPLPVVRCETSDLLVPAEAEIVIECTLRPGERAPEGPFGEALGYMEGVAPASVLDVDCITLRDGALLHGLIQQVPPSEGHVLMETGLVGSLWHALTGPMKVRGLVDMAVVPGAAGVSILAASVRRGDRESVAQVLDAMQRLSWGQKLVVVVDDDVDVRRPEQVLWALSSRADLATDVLRQPDAPLFQWDPAALQRVGGLSGRAGGATPTTEKLLVDATLRTDSMAVALPSSEMMERVRRDWARTGLPPLPAPSPLDRLLAGNAEDGIERPAPSDPS